MQYDMFVNFLIFVKFVYLRNSPFRFKEAREK